MDALTTETCVQIWNTVCLTYSDGVIANPAITQLVMDLQLSKFAITQYIKK